MNPSLAAALYVAGIAGLFVLDWDKSVHTSKALWLPVIWLSIIGSRPVSIWLGVGEASSSGVQLGDGSPVDAAIFGILLAVGIIILYFRKQQARACLKASWPIVIYFAYCLLSVLWSDFRDIAFKRWIKAVGDMVMVLVLVTDRDPIAALGRIISRTGFILMPMSVLLIKYFGNLGRGYDPDGYPMNGGVTTNKNMLGVITLVIGLGALWSFIKVVTAKRQSGRARHVLARGTLLGFCIAVLIMAQSATSLACFCLGTVLIVLTYLPMMRRRPGAVHVLVAMIVLAGSATMFFGGQAGIVHALGRQTNLTGRTDIWAAVLAETPNWLLGAGFESFWLGPRVARVWSHLSQYMHVNEAHNGYLEVYLNLGVIGVSLIALNLLSGYRGSVAAFRRDSGFGGLMLAYVAASSIYSATEAGFRMLDPIWFFFLLAIVGSHSIASGAIGRLKQNVRSRKRQAAMPPASLVAPLYS
jgi:exopolysaccharide production protein ExoQ